MKTTAHHVVTGSDGKTRFEEKDVAFSPVDDVSPGGVFHAAPLGSNDVALVRFTGDFTCDFHNTAQPTWMFMMKGRLELEVSGGAKRIIEPGDVVFYSDADGEGHRSRALGEEIVVSTAGYGG